MCHRNENSETFHEIPLEIKGFFNENDTKYELWNSYTYAFDDVQGILWRIIVVYFQTNKFNRQ